MSEDTEQQLPPPLGEHYSHVTKPCDECSNETKRLAVMAGVGGFMAAVLIVAVIAKVRAHG